MSTTFGVHPLGKVIPLDEWDQIPDTDEHFIEVAFRGNRTGIRWINKLAHLLPDETLVYPLDNSAQGIYTIKDIKQSIND